jgi:hypothetical protein
VRANSSTQKAENKTMKELGLKRWSDRNFWLEKTTKIVLHVQF